jgi:uncharacterized protein with von Willebrand factor type A (vWA) domain
MPVPGHLADNVVHFGRVLRAAGLPVGSDRIQLALEALPHGGFGSRADFHATLAACLVSRAEHRDLFDQAFALFWRNPDLTGRMMALLLPQVKAAQPPGAPPPPPEHKRLADAFYPHRPPPPPPQPAPEAPPPLDLDMAMTFSERERLQKADFDAMTAEEWRAALGLVKRLAPLFEPLLTRRMKRAPRPGQLDLRATLRAQARGAEGVLRWRERRERPAPLVVLADISGSMSRYSRMLLHFAHALGHAEARVESFVFGTRLTRITRLLKQRDPDIAIAQVVREVQDWSGGTRIHECLEQFNRRWARRVLPSTATLLVISDGLEHGGPDDPECKRLAFEMERLHKSCRRLVWLNPLLRFAKFEPRAAGIRAMRPHVDAFLPAHNLESLADLARVLAAPQQKSPL